MRLGKDRLACGSCYEYQLASLGFQDECTELLNLTDEESISQLHRLNLLAGAQCLLTHTAHANSIDLAPYDLATQVGAINHEALRGTSRLKPEHILVRMRVHEETLLRAESSERDDTQEHLAPCYQEQVLACACERECRDGDLPTRGADGFLLEGIQSRESALFALNVIRKVSDQPVFALYDHACWSEDTADLATDSEGVFSQLCLAGFSGVGFLGFDPEASCKLTQKLDEVRNAFLATHADHQQYPAVLVFVDVSSLSPQAFEMWVEKLLKAGADLIGVTGQATAAHVGAIRGVVDLFNRYGESGLIA